MSDAEIDNLGSTGEGENVSECENVSESGFDDSRSRIRTRRPFSRGNIVEASG